MSDLPTLTADEHDLLQELFNIGVGRAAASLSRMVKQTVELAVPIIEFRTRGEMAKELGEDKPICSVCQAMDGLFSSQSLLLFPADSGLEVVRHMLGTKLSDETLAELQPEAMAEIGNVVLNACIGAIGKVLDADFTVGLPNFDISKPTQLLQVNNHSQDDIVLLIRISMTLSESKVSGYLAFLLGNISMAQLHKMLRQMISELNSA